MRLRRLTCSPAEAQARLQFELDQPPVAKNGNGVGARITLYNMGCRALKPWPRWKADLWADDELVYAYTTAGKIVCIMPRAQYEHMEAGNRALADRLRIQKSGRKKK